MTHTWRCKTSEQSEHEKGHLCQGIFQIYSFFVPDRWFFFLRVIHMSMCAQAVQERQTRMSWREQPHNLANQKLEEMEELSQQQQQRNSTGGGHACAFIQEHVNDLTRNFKAHAVLPKAAILSVVASVQLLSPSQKKKCWLRYPVIFSFFFLKTFALMISGCVWTKGRTVVER